MKRYNVRLIPAAHHDITEARLWYRKINPELSKKFTRQVEFTMEKICNFPLANAVRYNKVRIANLAKFPYAVHYIIENETIIVLAIHHTAINPNKWLNRLEL